MFYRKLIVLLSVVCFAAASWAGWELTAVTKAESQQRGANAMNTTVKLQVNGDKSRADFTESKNPMIGKDSYLVTRDGGKTAYMVNTKEKTYMKWDMAQMAGLAGQMTKMMQMKVTSPKVEKLLEEPGEKMVGFPTTHYRYRTSYTMETSFMGKKTSQSTVQEQDVWSTTEIGDLGMGLWLKKEGIKTGDASLDDLMKAHMEQIKGLPLKQITVTTTKDNKGKENVSKMTMEVTHLVKANPSDSLFEMPADYKETSMFGGAEGEGSGGEGNDGQPRKGQIPFMKMFQGGK